jgi:hypothetical protein
MCTLIANQELLGFGLSAMQRASPIAELAVPVGPRPGHAYGNTATAGVGGCSARRLSSH